MGSEMPRPKITNVAVCGLRPSEYALGPGWHAEGSRARQGSNEARICASEALEQALQILELYWRPGRFAQAPAQLFQDFARALNVDLVGNFDP